MDQSLAATHRLRRRDRRADQPELALLRRGGRPLTPGAGPPVGYLVRRIIPAPDSYPSVITYVITDGDRLDNLAQRFLGDHALYWMICDANGVTDPDELTAQAGRTIVIPVAAAVAAGSAQWLAGRCT